MIRRKSLARSRSRSLREGLAVVEFAAFLPVLVLVTFGAIQLSNTILLSHQSIAVLEAGALDYMVGIVDEANLVAHIESLAKSADLKGASISVTPVTQNLAAEGFHDATFLEISITVPIKGNLALPVVVKGGTEVSTTFQIYRPDDAPTSP